jgi:hypothetical protein
MMEVVDLRYIVITYANITVHPPVQIYANEKLNFKKSQGKLEKYLETKIFLDDILKLMEYSESGVKYGAIHVFK